MSTAEFSDSTPSPVPRWEPFKGIWKAFRHEQQKLWTYLLANVLIGLLGALVPVLIPIFRECESFLNGLIVALRAGSLYTFTIALLASTVILILQADRYHTTRKPVEDTRRVAVIITLCWVVVLGILTGMLAFAQLDAPSDLTIWARRDTVQSWMCGSGVVWAVIVFLLSVYEERLYTDRFAGEEDERVTILNQKATLLTRDPRGMDLDGASND